MPFIGTIEEKDAAGAVGELYAADRADRGYVMNMTRAFAHRPDVLTAWDELNDTIKGGMELRRYELATLAAARQLRSSYCMLAHGSVLVERFYEPEVVRSLAAGEPTAALDEVDVAVMDLAAKVAKDATTVDQGDVERLKSLGLSDRDVVDVVLAASVRCFFTKTLDALGVQPDAAYAQLEPSLREALTVGRPITAAD